MASNKPSSKPAGKQAKTQVKSPAKQVATPKTKVIAKTTMDKTTAKANNASSVVPFSPFAPEFTNKFTNKFTNNNQAMETIMNTQKNQFEKFSTETSEQAREAGDIMMKSGTMMMQGMEQILKTCMTMAQDSSTKNADAMKQLMTCKTINDFTEAQNKLSQQNFDNLMQNATKLSEICIKVCTEALDPINDQMSKAIKKASAQKAA